MKDGLTDVQIASELGRTASAVQHKRSNLKIYKYQTHKAQTPTLFSSQRKEPKKEAKYTRYMKPSTEVSILWGLVKFSKA